MVPVVRRRTFVEARQILNELCLRLDGKEASTNKRASQERNLNGVLRSWWVEHDEVCPPFDSPRSKAYLAAYVLIAGPLFYGTGIPLDRDLLLPDRGVMKSLLLAGCVEIGQTRPGLFELTAKGRELIAGLDLQISDAPVGV
jgi:hypothetical protein